MPLNINTVEVKIGWPLSSTTLCGGEIPQGAGIFLLRSQSLRSCEYLLMPQEELQTRKAEGNKTHWSSSVAPYTQRDVGFGNQFSFHHNRQSALQGLGLNFSLTKIYC